MLYNLKADIVYYKTGSDFELEFNLCGCCRMRLLTDKCSNKKAFVHSLARAVARSRVILIAGPIFGDENTIQIVSQALGTSTEIVNNNEYNIASDEQIEILKGSLPLVLADGSFGGCIIESGPQTMILLTDNKTLRKSIMSTLIHPYISELYTSETQAPTPSQEDTSSTETSNDNLENELLLTTEDEEENEEIKALLIEDNVDLIDIDESSDTEESELVPKHDILESVPIILPNESEIEENEEDSENNEISDNFNDITINDLFSHAPDDIDTTETPYKKDIEPEILLEENTENEVHVIPEEYEKTFNKLFWDNETDENENNSRNISSFKLLHDDGDVVDDDYNELNTKTSISRLQIAILIVTSLLLLAIIVLCYSTFVVSANQGVSAAEYIQTIFNTVFGKM